jgi:hypothetical protein
MQETVKEQNYLYPPVVQKPTYEKFPMQKFFLSPNEFVNERTGKNVCPVDENPQCEELFDLDITYKDTAAVIFARTVKLVDTFNGRLELQRNCSPSVNYIDNVITNLQSFISFVNARDKHQQSGIPVLPLNNYFMYWVALALGIHNEICKISHKTNAGYGSATLNRILHGYKRVSKEEKATLGAGENSFFRGTFEEDFEWFEELFQFFMTFRYRLAWTGLMNTITAYFSSVLKLSNNFDEVNKIIYEHPDLQRGYFEFMEFREEYLKGIWQPRKN